MREKFTIFKGQSLFEVVFAIGIAALILVGVASLAATSIRNSSFSRNNAMATKFAQEGIEWVREQRDTDWNNLYSRTPTGTPIGIGSLDWTSGASIPNTIFSRTVSLQYQTTVTLNDTIEATVEVTWSDSQGTHTVRSITRFTNWNR